MQGNQSRRKGRGARGSTKNQGGRGAETAHASTYTPFCPALIRGGGGGGTKPRVSLGAHGGARGASPPFPTEGSGGVHHARYSIMRLTNEASLPTDSLPSPTLQKPTDTPPPSLGARSDRRRLGPVPSRTSGQLKSAPRDLHQPHTLHAWFDVSRNPIATVSGPRLISTSAPRTECHPVR